MKTFTTPAPIAAVLDVPAGRIRLVATDRTDTAVEVRPANAAKSRDVAAAEQTSVEFADGVLRIAAGPARHQALGPSGSVELTVHLPAGSRVEAGAAAADFRATGRLGEVVVEAAQGPVAIEEAAGARIVLQAGAISVGRLGGAAELTTEQGDITVTEALDGSLTLRTRAGNLSVTAAAGVSATLDAATASGRIHNALRNTTGSAAGLTVRATTSYGDITARGL